MDHSRLNAWVRDCAALPERGMDRDQVRQALGVLCSPGGVHELRGLPSGRSRYVRPTDLDAAVQAAWELSDGTGVYFTLNPCRGELNGAAKAGDITERRWLLIDVDAQRPTDTNATEEEKAHALELLFRAIDWLGEQGWPNPVMIDSGNGGHALYRIELANDKLSQQLLKGVLGALASRFDDGAGKIDRAVHNASRISKLPGTWARKGPDSPERPHRMAMLKFAPDPVEVVTVEQLQAVAGPAEPRRPEPSPNGTGAHGAASSELEHYVAQAIDRECAKVETATAGTRNSTLNTAAFNLGQMATWPEMLISQARAALLESAIRSGLGDLESRKTIESGWVAGAATPRDRAAKLGPDIHYQEGVAADGAAKLTIGLDEIVEEDVDWIYENVIAIGFISIFAGQTSQGKSFVVCDLIARLTRGDFFPFSEDRRPPSHVLMISEDPLEQMLAPRLNTMGALRGSVRFMKWEAMASYTLHDTAMLDRAYLECREPILLVIDPPANFLGRVDEHKNAEVRSVLMRVVAWLQKRLAACILIIHVNKQIGKGLTALDRIMGSVAWATTPRMAIGFTDNPEVAGQHIMAGIKNNLGPKAQALIYKVLPVSPKRARIEWVGISNLTADDAMNQVRKSRCLNAVEWLVELFRQQREWASSEFWNAAKQNGISKNAIDESRTRLAIPKPRKTVNPNGETFWTWWVPDDWRYLGEDP